ncbi:hypothetical protein BST61_g6632 [Cercospora zeina]
MKDMILVTSPLVRTSEKTPKPQLSPCLRCQVTLLSAQHDLDQSNRRINIEKEQMRSLIRKGISADFAKKKALTFATCDFSRPYLGLSVSEYKDFIGVRQLVDFSAHSKYGAMIFFVSSVGAVSSLRQAQGADGRPRPVPEGPIGDWSAASMESGYGQSKLVAERILATAAKEAGIPCAICRVGQIAGSSPGEGDWQRNEWLPTLVVSSRNMGCLSTSLGSFNNVDWVPIDLAAKIVLDFVGHAARKLLDSPNQPKVYHAVNPRPMPGQSLLPAVQSSLAVEKLCRSRNGSISSRDLEIRASIDSLL